MKPPRATRAIVADPQVQSARVRRARGHGLMPRATGVTRGVSTSFAVRSTTLLFPFPRFFRRRSPRLASRSFAPLAERRHSLRRGRRVRRSPPVQAPLGDIEDLVEKHPGVLSVVSSAPAARASLLDWYDANHRVLPWRRNRRSKHALPPTTDARDPDAVASGRAYWRGVATTGAPIDVPPEQYAYGVWVSEIMSQQTQIERVAQYWLRWTDRWPTAAALAAASQEEVNEMWAGLGYYRRARFLLNGARHVCGLPPIGDETRGDDATRLANIAASFPTSAKDDSATSGGVGPYTAAAVASIAFDEPIAAVDGNVIRVAARLACVRDGGDATKPGSSAARARGRRRRVVGSRATGGS